MRKVLQIREPVREFSGTAYVGAPTRRSPGCRRRGSGRLAGSRRRPSSRERLM